MAKASESMGRTRPDIRKHMRSAKRHFLDLLLWALDDARCVGTGHKRQAQSVRMCAVFVRNWRSLGESNPCFRRERATS